MPTLCPDRFARGFSLIEVLFALAIVGLALGTAATVFSNGLLGHNAAGDVDTALALAQEKLAAAGVTTPLGAGETHGDFAGRFAWRVTTARFDDKELDAAPPSALTLYRIEAQVAWRDGLRQREIALQTLRLATVAP